MKQDNNKFLVFLWYASEFNLVKGKQYKNPGNKKDICRANTFLTLSP